MILELEYGYEKLKLDIPEKNILQVLSSKPVEILKDPAFALKQSLHHPIGFPSLKEKVKNKKNICIVISDSTRAVPTKLILEVLLPELESYGIERDSILILIATGLHRPNLGEELEGLVGKDIAADYRIKNHYARDRQS